MVWKRNGASVTPCTKLFIRNPPGSRAAQPTAAVCGTSLALVAARSQQYFRIQRHELAPAPAAFVDAEGVVADLMVISDPRANMRFHPLIANVPEHLLDEGDTPSIHLLDGAQHGLGSACPVAHGAVPLRVIFALVDPQVNQGREGSLAIRHTLQGPLEHPGARLRPIGAELL